MDSIKMNEDYSKAVSFTNSYFALADGLVSGLENCLAENVVLDWFGKTIKGSTNVAAFMHRHKVNSRHVFNYITPTESIGYKSRRLRIRYTSGFLSNGNISFDNRLNLQNNPVNEITSSADRSRSLSKIDAEKNHLEENDLTFELNDDDTSTLFKLENIRSTNVKEIEQKISQMSIEEKAKMKSPRKKEFKEVHGFENVNLLESSIKYVEASGEILFSKKSCRQSDWSVCKIISTNSTQTWKKPCKLQIAYSSQQINCQQFICNNNSTKCENTSNFESEQNLLNFDQITELSNNLIPNDNDFAGYLRNINFVKEEDAFFKNLNEHLSKNEAKKLDLIPRYIDGQLVFQKINTGVENDSQNSFVFKNLIHVIIYEGRSRCRINLSQKFV